MTAYSGNAPLSPSSSMQIKPVAEVLGRAGFDAPALKALIPDVNNYSVLLLQPSGDIEATADGVHNHDQPLATKQFSRFIKDAVNTHADLALTPEYSMPWSVLTDSIKNGAHPEPGKLWVFGCESIDYNLLPVLREELAQYATLLCETIETGPKHFTDPLAYVFQAPVQGSSELALVVLVQFKMHPMGDDDHFEISALQRGSCVYQFGGGNQIRLISILCSDSFAFFDKEAKEVYDRTLILHLQLNPKPRQTQYRGYREKLFTFAGDATEIICLNWAQNVHERSEKGHKDWKNISASAWYLRPDKFDTKDLTLGQNHRKGLYYTWCQSMRTHSLFFNFAPATFLIEATKVYHANVPASVSRRRGPQLITRSVWDTGHESWAEETPAQDGLAAIVDQAGKASANVNDLAQANPFGAERALALCAGRIEPGTEWYRVDRLDSCVIDTTEVICRMTFCQDTDKKASDFRIARLKRCANLWTILTNDEYLPPALSDMKGGTFRLDWSDNAPHQNVISDKGRRATTVYMGEECTEEQVEATARRIADCLNTSGNTPDESLAAKQRLAVWYRIDGVVKLFEQHRYVKIDQIANASDFDFGRPE